MSNAWKIVGVLLVIFLVISFILNYWFYIVAGIGAYFGIKRYLKYRKEQQAFKLEAQEQQRQLAQKSTLEYKMNRLLTLAGYATNNWQLRHAYKTKPVLNLQDYWHHYMDLRAKLSLNDTHTYREEGVLDYMCDELLQRLDNAEYEATTAIKKEFIEENLTPLLKDVVEIMSGISPQKTINIDAYQLLKADRMSSTF